MLPRIANVSGKQYGQGGNRILQLWVRSLCSRSLHDRELMTCSAKAETIQESYFRNPRRQVVYGLLTAKISRFIQKSIINESRFLTDFSYPQILQKFAISALLFLRQGITNKKIISNKTKEETTSYRVMLLLLKKAKLHFSTQR